MTDESPTSDSSRRTVLKTLAAAGIAGTGLTGASGSAAAGPPDHAQNPETPPGRDDGTDELTFDIEREGTFTDLDDVEAAGIADVFEDGANGTFDGELSFTDFDVNDEGELIAIGELDGELSSNPTEAIDETFEVVLGAVEDVLDTEPGEVPILDLVIEPIFLDLLGLELETETIDLDLMAVGGEGNLVGNLLIAVTTLLDP